jgi:hypothetical protein
MSLISKKEHSFLKKICLTALSVDKSLKFAAAVDNNGKLLAGECNNKHRFFKNNNTLIKSSIFYLHYLIPTIRKQQKDRTEYCFHDHVHNNNNNNIFHFNLSDIDNNVYLVITPLTEQGDRYLCIYLESYSISSSSSSKVASSPQQIILKISAALC